MSEGAITPYAGTSGWSGTTTSRDRAVTEDADGTTESRQGQVLRLVRSAGPFGVTVADVRKVTAMHHGQASSALTILHREGVIQRLSNTRNRCKVYVVTSDVQGRQIEPYASRQSKRDLPKTDDHIVRWLTARASGRPHSYQRYKIISDLVEEYERAAREERPL